MDNNNINILHIVSGDLWAGAEVQLFTLATSLQRQKNTTVHVVLLNHGTLEQKLLNNNIRVVVLDETSMNGIHILLQLIRTIAKIQPDVIHTHRIKENILGSIAAMINKTPSLRTAHGAPEHKPTWFHIPKRLILFLDWFCARYLQKIIVAVSDDLAEILKNNLPANKIKTIENGIDLSSTTQRNILMREQSTLIKIGIAGRLVPIKRVDIFIAAAAELLNKYPELKVSFHIFGDGPLRKDLEELSQELNTNKMVHFEGHCENMQKELLNLDALVLTSDHEGLPMILLEAMALQTPIIAHSVGGIPTLLKQGECGVLVTNHKPSAYAEDIYQLMISQENRTKLVNNAFNRVNTSYSSTQNATAYHTIYRELIS